MSSIVPVLMLMNVKWTKKELTQSNQIVLVVGIILSVLGFGLFIPSLYINDVGKTLGSICFAMIGIFFIWIELKNAGSKEFKK